jgi:hypothetical protein
LAPEARANISPRMCIGEPLPGLAYESDLPAPLAAATASFAVAMPLPPLATRKSGWLPVCTIGVKPASTS